jgi:hypothetical protein
MVPNEAAWLGGEETVTAAGREIKSPAKRV